MLRQAPVPVNEASSMEEKGRMRMLVLLVVLVLGAAWLTKPEQADAEAALREQVMLSVARQELGEGRSTGENLALAACKLRPSDCYDLLRSGLEVTYTDRKLFVQVDVTGFERQARCYGAFTRFFCPGGFREG